MDKKSLVIVYTGHGKGKTTAALGLVFRALGRKKKVLVVQFIKGKWKTGEKIFADSLDNLDFYVMGRGFTWESNDLSIDKEAANKAWGVAKEGILSKKYDVIILDEISYTLHFSFLNLDDVLDTLNKRGSKTDIVLTGRDMDKSIVEVADLVSEMKKVKHPFDKGIKAKPGIDF